MILICLNFTLTMTSRKAVKAFNTIVFLNNILVAHCSTHKHLGMYLDEKLNFGHYITKNLQKPTK